MVAGSVHRATRASCEVGEFRTGYTIGANRRGEEYADV